MHASKTTSPNANGPTGESHHVVDEDVDEDDANAKPPALAEIRQRPDSGNPKPPYVQSNNNVAEMMDRRPAPINDGSSY